VYSLKEMDSDMETQVHHFPPFFEYGLKCTWKIRFAFSLAEPSNIVHPYPLLMPHLWLILQLVTMVNFWANSLPTIEKI
jgi:hypothetical protein